jgi:two-component system, cell cycle response regulator CpdR
MSETPIQNLDRSPRMAAGQQAGAVTGRTDQVLVVDDDKATLRLLMVVLGRAGYSVITARTAEEAWNMILDGRQRIDLVLTDVSMPGAFDGVELAERVRVGRAGLPVLLMTNPTNIERLPRKVALAWEPFLLCKPFPIAPLLKMVRDNLERKFIPNPPITIRPFKRSSDGNIIAYGV